MKLTYFGLSNLEYGAHVGKPEPAFSVRPDLTLEDRSLFECMLMLEEQGFEWSLFPGGDRKDLVYHVGGPKIWYSTGTQICIRYSGRHYSGVLMGDMYGVASVGWDGMSGELWCGVARRARVGRGGLGGDAAMGA